MTDAEFIHEDDWRADQDEMGEERAERLDGPESEADVLLRASLALESGRSLEGDDDNYRIVDDDGAQWALRVMAHAQSEIQRLEAAAEREVERILIWKATASRRPQETVEKMEALLVDYRRRLELEQPDLPKTYKLPNGTIVRRAGSAKVDVYDPDRFVAWALVNDIGAVRVAPAVSGLRGKGSKYRTARPEADVKKTAAISPTGATEAFITPDGEIVPGVQLYVPPDTYGAKATR